MSNAEVTPIVAPATAIATAQEAKEHPPKIHPIITYPFGKANFRNLTALYETLISKLASAPDKYSRPLTIVNNQTFYNNTAWGHGDDKDYVKQKETFAKFQTDYVEKYSDRVLTWSVDTCQMWLSGFGHCYNTRNIADVYWLIPGDFDYASDAGLQVLDKLPNLPGAVVEGTYDLVLGEIKVPLNSSKQLIDTYGTYGLLYNWFPAEAQGIRTITDKPRSEFIAISHNFLDTVLRRRWYPYEQSIVILLHGMRGKEALRRMHKVDLGEITDLAEGRDTLSVAMQQVERTERVLKLYWREYHEQLVDREWRETFRKLDAQSQQIRGAALVILEQILRS